MAIRHTVSLTVLMLLAALLLGGCIAIPVSSKTTQTFIEIDSLSFLEAGRTSKSDVRDALGDPWKTDETDSQWTYELGALLSGRWAGCVAIPPGFGDCGVSDGTLELQLLKIEFDNEDIVSSWYEFERSPDEIQRADEISRHLVVGKTTGNDVTDEFGQPNYGGGPEPSMLYTNTRREWLLSPYIKGGKADKPELYIELDDQGVLRHFELIDATEPEHCVATGVCIIRYGWEFGTLFVMFTRPPDEDREAKQFDQAAGQCSVYLYGDVAYDKADAVTAWHFFQMDEQFSALFSPAYYLNWRLSPGQHQIGIQNANSVDSDSGSIVGGLFSSDRDDEYVKTISKTIECVSGDVYFLALAEMIKTDGIFNPKVFTSDFSLTLVDSDIGKINVLERDLASGLIHFLPQVDLDFSSPAE